VAEAHLILVRVPADEAEAWVRAAARWLTAPELARAQERVPEVRVHHMVGRAVLRLVAAGLAGDRDPQAVTVAETPEGKPHLPELPEFGVSVAHSDRVVVVAACAHAEVGVDVEPITAVTADVNRLSARLFSTEEAQRLAHLEPEAARVEFLRYWTIKEAVGKALGTGYVPALRGALVELQQPGGPVHGPLRLRAVSAGHNRCAWTLHCVELEDGGEHVALVVADAEIALAPVTELTVEQLGNGLVPFKTV